MAERTPQARDFVQRKLVGLDRRGLSDSGWLIRSHLRQHDERAANEERAHSHPCSTIHRHSSFAIENDLTFPKSGEVLVHQASQDTVEMVCPLSSVHPAFRTKFVLTPSPAKRRILTGDSIRSTGVRETKRLVPLRAIRYT